MDALKAIAERCSTRRYASKTVPREVMEQIVDAGRRAPTARNEQPWAFVVVTDAETRAKIGDLCDYGGFIAEAPACIAVFCRKTKYYLEDGCAATENILLAATALGVQSCWVAGDKKPYAATIARILGAPEEQLLVALISLGYAHDAPKVTAKHELGEVIHWETF
jgi:nitroreductase